MSQEPNPSPEELAAEFLSRRASGEAVAQETCLARLEGEAARAEFLDLVAGAGRAERGLPRVLATGSLIAGRYRVRELIGAGGMGKVFSAFDENLRREVAVKVLAPLASGNRQREEMFAKESRILADLKHPGIVTVHDAGNDGEFTYIVMERVDGVALLDVLDRARDELGRKAKGGKLPARDGRLLAAAVGRKPGGGRQDLIDPDDWYRSSAKIVLEIARTLEAAHEQHVVHRDLKPANVMLLGGGAPIVLDFGLAGSPDLKQVGVTESLQGSLPYLAPEQVKSDRVGMDPRTDVYQLGLILYEMLTLKRAFPGTSVGDVLERIQQGYFTPPRKTEAAVPRDLEAVCMRALELAPERRYESARALREDLERWLEGQAPIASRSARWRTFVRTLRYTGKRHPVLTAAVGMILVGGGIYLWRKGEELPPVPPDVSFFKINAKDPGRSARPIDPAAPVVEVGDFLGINLVQSGEGYVYALSVFGSEGKGRYVAPWCAADAEHLEELHPTGPRPWGWHVSKPFEQIACVQIEPDKQGKLNDWEGLLVLVSEKPRPELERWREQLERKQGQTGVLYDEALSVLEAGEPDTRGVPLAASWDKGELETVREALIRARKKVSQKLGLPGVKDYSIECRVLAK